MATHRPPPPPPPTPPPAPTPLTAIRANDPNHAGVEVDNTPPPGATTTDPHRITLVVPTPDLTVFSLGMGANLATRIKDTGITGRTKTHAHFHTTDPAATQTMVALGGGTLEGWANEPQPNNLANNKGFMAVTAGMTWIEAKQHCYAISLDGDATLRTSGEHKRVVVQSDKGDINLVAKEAMLTSAAVIVLSAPAAVVPNVGVNYGPTGWTGDVPESHAGKWGSAAGSLAAIMNGAYELAKSYKKTWKHLRHGKRAQKIEGSISAVKLLAEAGEMVAAFLELKETFSTEKPEGGVVKIAADDSLSLLSGKTAGLAASIAVSVSGGVWATVAAGVSASLKAVGFAAMSAAVSSVSGAKKVEIASESGEVEVLGAKGVSIQAEAEDLSLGAHEGSIHLHAKSGFVTIGSMQGVTLASGDGDGMGLCVKPNELGLGLVTSTTALLSAKPEDKLTILMNADNPSILAKAASCHVLVDGKANNAEIKGKTIHLLSDDGAIDLANGKILIGH